MYFSELKTVTEVQDLIQWHNRNSEYVGLDTETTGLDPFRDSITDIVLSGKEPDSAHIFSSAFATTLRELTKPVVCHNFKFDFHMLLRTGVDLRISGLYADTLLLDHLLDENQEHSLDAIVKRRFQDNYKEVFWDTYKNYTVAPHQTQLDYACKDVIYTLRAFRGLIGDLTEAGIPKSLITHVHTLALSLYDTEVSGIQLDLSYLNIMATELEQSIDNLKSKMRSIVQIPCVLIENEAYIASLDLRTTAKGKANVKRTKFNFDSPKQIAELLYSRLNLPKQINKKRKVTVDDGALEAIEAKHPVVPLLRAYRGYQKLFTAFIEGSLEKMYEGRIYPSFNVNGTVTGRISSSNPNMQQLPKEGKIRGIYIPPKDYKLISCDYSQLEVTLAAHFSRDANLLKIVYDGASQHDITATGLGIPRGQAKTLNFAMQYGAGVDKVSQILGCSRGDAEIALNKYWQTYRGLADFIKLCHREVEQGKPLTNPFGRQRHFPTTFEDKWALEKAKRQSANSLIQGTGADLTNMAFYQVNDDLHRLGLGRALFPIHDEILIEVKDSACEEATNILISRMRDVGKLINLSVPLEVSCSRPMERWMKG